MTDARLMNPSCKKLARHLKTFNELPLTARMSDNVLAFREIMDNIYV